MKKDKTNTTNQYRAISKNMFVYFQTAVSFVSNEVMSCQLFISVRQMAPANLPYEGTQLRWILNCWKTGLIYWSATLVHNEVKKCSSGGTAVFGRPFVKRFARSGPMWFVL